MWMPSRLSRFHLNAQSFQAAFADPVNAAAFVSDELLHTQRPLPRQCAIFV